jgi:hypothetical protein
VHFIDYYQAEGEGLPHYIRALQARVLERGYIYGEHIGPHDIEHGHFIVGQTVKARAKEYGVDFAANPRVDDQQKNIENSRVCLPLCRFNQPTCQQGLDALWSYSKKWNDKTRRWSDRPLHDWASDGADAFAEACKHINRLRLKGQIPSSSTHPVPQDWMAG